MFKFLLVPLLALAALVPFVGAAKAEAAGKAKASSHRCVRKYSHRRHRMVFVCRQKHRRHRHRRATWVLPRRVVMCESGGNKRAVNYRNPLRPAGLYQIITPTWRAYGGGRYASTADRASVREQGIIARRVLRNQGSRAWECW